MKIPVLKFLFQELSIFKLYFEKYALTYKYWDQELIPPQTLKKTLNGSLSYTCFLNSFSQTFFSA